MPLCYTWDQANQHKIQERWSHVASEWLKKHLFNAWMFDKQPDDINDAIWEQLKVKWNPTYKHQKNIQNPAANSGTSVSIHQGGSRLTSKSKRKLGCFEDGVEEGDIGEIDEDEIWLQIVRSKKGRAYELGNLEHSVTCFCLQSEASSESSRNSHEMGLITQQGVTIRKLWAELELQKAEINRIIYAMNQHGIHLPDQVRS